MRLALQLHPEHLAHHVADAKSEDGDAQADGRHLGKVPKSIGSAPDMLTKRSILVTEPSGKGEGGCLWIRRSLWGGERYPYGRMAGAG